MPIRTEPASHRSACCGSRPALRRSRRGVRPRHRFAFAGRGGCRRRVPVRVHCLLRTYSGAEAEAYHIRGEVCPLHCVQGNFCFPWTLVRGNSAINRGTACTSPIRDVGSELPLLLGGGWVLNPTGLLAPGSGILSGSDGLGTGACFKSFSRFARKSFVLPTKAAIRRAQPATMWIHYSDLLPTSFPQQWTERGPNRIKLINLNNKSCNFCLFCFHFYYCNKPGGVRHEELPQPTKQIDV